jgi:probable HAF family extracellular repeat protein
MTARALGVALALGTLARLPAAPAAQDAKRPPAAVVDLGTLGGPDSSASGINDRGQIVGFSISAAFETRAVMWEDGRLIELGELPDALNCSANAINNRGEIVGSCDRVEGGGGFLWRDGAMIDLGLLPGQTLTYPTAINDAGVVVGAAFNPNGEPSLFVWHDGVLTDIGGSGLDYAAAINKRGQIAGWRLGETLEHRALLWDRGRIIELGMLPGAGFSQAWAMNDRTEIVGRSGFAGAFVWADGVMRALDGLPGAGGALAFAINNHGAAVGQSPTAAGESHAVLWPDTRRRGRGPGAKP